MKAIIIGHERGGSVVLEQCGDYRFVHGYTSETIGTEIEVRSRSVIQFIKTTACAACVRYSRHKKREIS